MWQLLQGQNVSRRSLQDDIEEEHGDESLTSMEVREKDSETETETETETKREREGAELGGEVHPLQGGRGRGRGREEGGREGGRGGESHTSALQGEDAGRLVYRIMAA